MEHTSHEPKPPVALPAARPYQTRHDGWTGEKMATFCEALAETAVVAEACDLAGMGLSGAYAARRRNPVFAAAWDAALSIARERLADVLLERAMEGTRELYFKDGEMVGERHLIDSRLGLAILRRLDRLAETGLSLHSNLQEPHPPAILPRSAPFDWERMVAALRSDDADEVAQALALIESNKVDEVEDPLNRPPSSDEDEGLDLTDRCWRDAIERCWMTDFPPPSGFSGYQSRAYDSDDEDERYIRTCTPDEAAVLDSNEIADRAAERAQEEALRDEWFAMLRSEVETLDGNRPS